MTSLSTMNSIEGGGCCLFLHGNIFGSSSGGCVLLHKTQVTGKTKDNIMNRSTKQQQQQKMQPYMCMNYNNSNSSTPVVVIVVALRDYIHDLTSHKKIVFIATP